MINKENGYEDSSSCSSNSDHRRAKRVPSSKALDLNKKDDAINKNDELDNNDHGS